MDARELKIDNYVWEDYGGYMIVRGISTTELTLVKQINLPSGKYSIEKVEPIPLTEETLSKCGFINNPLHEHPSFDEFIHCKFKWFEIGDFNGEYFLIEALDQMAGTESPQIKHLHQLQNLFFAITGEELQVNL